MKVAPLALVAVGVAVLAAGCAALGAYVWADELPAFPVRSPPEYVIRPGDQLSVRVYGQDSISGTVRVRDDGCISLPMVGDQLAAGLRPKDVAELLRASLQTFIRKPTVVVALENRRASQISVVGQVTFPGVFEIERGRGVLDAIALAGGLTRFARDDRIFVVRSGTETWPAKRVRFRYRDLLDGEPHSVSFGLQDGDVVFVQ
jgi:polysaccharide biosynthesis/export protein